MARPRKGYGKGIVGVTTVLGMWGNKNGMIHAAWKLGTDGVDYREEWRGAADSGTLAHDLIEAHLLGKPEPDLSGYPPDVKDKAETCFLGFLKWAELVNFKILDTELSLVDERLGYGGTLDLAAVQGERCIIDWKTSKAIYLTAWLQLAAYKHLYELHHFGEGDIRDFYILQLNKEDGGFSYHHQPNLDKHLEMFLTLLKAYKLDKELGG